MRWLLAPFIWLGRILHWLRVALLNLITLAVLAAIALALFVRHAPMPSIPEKAALAIMPQGHLVYTRSQSWELKLMDELIGASRPNVLVRHLVTAIDRAAADPRIRLLALNLTDFRGGSITQLNTVAQALQRFRASGKPIYAFAPSYSQGAYLLASQANHIYMPRLGIVLIDGFSVHHLYFKNLLNKLGVTIYAFREGKYKSAVEPLTRTDMSPAAQTENKAWLQTWWQTYLQAAAKGRSVPDTQIAAYADNLPQLLAATQGNGAQLALQRHLITRIGNEYDFKKAVAKALGQPAESLSTVGVITYLKATTKPVRAAAEIAVVPIDGVLMPGDSPEPGVVAAAATVRQINRLRKNASVKAVVLQVNSPGGSVDAANDIRDAILRLRESGKPVVVAMGTLGASGAYWLSTAAERIYARPTTLAGDIGVFALVPNFAGTLKKLGINYSGVGTTPNAGALSPVAPLSPNVQQALQAVVGHIYHRFIELVAKSRHMSLSQAEQAAQGRAWSGVDAKKLGLVDGLGGMPEALADAAKLAKLKPGTYRVGYLNPPASGRPLGQLALPRLAKLGSALLPSATPVLGESLWQAELLINHAQPYGIFAYAPIAPRIE